MMRLIMVGKNTGDDFREGKITLPVVLAFRRGTAEERSFWERTLQQGDRQEGDLERAVELMHRHSALEDTILRARHYGAMAIDALAIFPESRYRDALTAVVEFCINRNH
jgi:octaprenyl-diphosphate synthase